MLMGVFWVTGSICTMGNTAVQLQPTAKINANKPVLTQREGIYRNVRMGTSPRPGANYRRTFSKC